MSGADCRTAAFRQSVPVSLLLPRILLVYFPVISGTFPCIMPFSLTAVAYHFHSPTCTFYSSLAYSGLTSFGTPYFRGFPQETCLGEIPNFPQFPHFTGAPASPLYLSCLEIIALSSSSVVSVVIKIFQVPTTNYCLDLVRTQTLCETDVSLFI